MNAACATLGLVPGDTFDLRINLYSGTDGNRLPLQMAPGEVFVLTLGRVVATTAAAGPDRLQVLASAEHTAFLRQFTPAETGRFRAAGPCGPPLDWSFVRIPAPGIRRTYARGPIVLTPSLSPSHALGLSPTGCAGPAPRVVDLVVGEGGVTLEMGGVPDVASYTDAREAALRADLAEFLLLAETRAAAFALLL